MLSRLRPRRRRTPPRLSVVLPVHGVEHWLPSCLDSIAAQTFTDYEVVVVDDGSPDHSAAIVAERAARDPRIRLLRQENAGLGAARNAGIRQARGELLTFVDGDDEVLPDAWQRMVSTLDRTGSDFVSARPERLLESGRRRTTRLMSRVHGEDHLATTLDEVPLALADVFAWNKVFRSDFWHATELSYPERVRYEDQPVSTKAFLRARRFDILADPVYLWRVRSDGTSITQARHRIEDLVDRATTKELSAGLVMGAASSAVRDVFFREVLPVDMWEYFRASVQAEGDYWVKLVGLVRELWNPATVPFEHTAVSAQQRLMGWLVSQDRREDLTRWIALLDGEGGPHFEDGVLVHPWRDELRISRES